MSIAIDINHKSGDAACRHITTAVHSPMKITGFGQRTGYYATAGNEYKPCHREANDVWVNANGEPLTEEERKSAKETITVFVDGEVKAVVVDNNGNKTDETTTNRFSTRIDSLAAMCRNNAEVSEMLNKHPLEFVLEGAEIDLKQEFKKKGENIVNTDATYDRDTYKNDIVVTALAPAKKAFLNASRKASQIEEMQKAFPHLDVQTIISLLG